jgi:hypothetical protein
MAQCGCFGGGLDFGERLGHAGKAEFMQPIERWMGEQDWIS